MLLFPSSQLKGQPAIHAQGDTGRRGFASKGWRKTQFCVIYAAVLALISVRKPMWLDELIQWKVAIAPHEALFRSIAETPGAVPLGYLIERGIVNIGLTTPLALRSVSILAGLFSALAIGELSESLIPGTGAKATLVLAVLPLNIRYATEARPYEMALALSLAGTLLFWRVMTKVTLPAMVTYIGTSAIAVYLQPLSFFVCFGHLCFAISQITVCRKRFFAATLSVGMVFLLFLPWYLWARSGWSTAIHVACYRFSLSWRMPLLLIREISGAGYLVSIPLIGFAVVGLCRGRFRGSKRLFLLCLIIAPTALVLSADAWSSYFVAIRQFIFILPGLVIAAVEGMHVAVTVFPSLRTVLLPIVLASQTIPVYRSLRSTETENWKAAAAKARSWLPAGQCVLYVPNDARGLYELVDRDLTGRACNGNYDSTAVVPISPYAASRQVAEYEKSLISISRRVDYRAIVGRSRIEVLASIVAK